MRANLYPWELPQTIAGAQVYETKPVQAAPAAPAAVIAPAAHAAAAAPAAIFRAAAPIVLNASASSASSASRQPAPAVSHSLATSASSSSTAAAPVVAPLTLTTSTSAPSSFSQQPALSFRQRISAAYEEGKKQGAAKPIAPTSSSSMAASASSSSTSAAPAYIGLIDWFKSFFTRSAPNLVPATASVAMPNATVNNVSVTLPASVQAQATQALAANSATIASQPSRSK